VQTVTITLAAGASVTAAISVVLPRYGPGPRECEGEPRGLGGRKHDHVTTHCLTSTDGAFGTDKARAPVTVLRSPEHPPLHSACNEKRRRSG
jgi:hypothetical protein